MIIPEHDDWEVQEILGSKTVGGKLKYRIKLVGADGDPEYWPASDCMYALHKIKKFPLKYPNAKGIPRVLPKWIKAYEWKG